MYLVEYMDEIGYPNPEQGHVPHSEILAWSNAMGLNLEPWEHNILYRMLALFAYSLSRFNADEHIPAPYETEYGKMLRRKYINKALESDYLEEARNG